MYRSLRASPTPPPDDLRLRRASAAGEPLTPSINEWAKDALGVPVHDHYGQTEAGMMINNHHHPACRRPLKSGSMGHEMPGWTAAAPEEIAYFNPGGDGTRPPGSYGWERRLPSKKRSATRTEPGRGRVTGPVGTASRRARSEPSDCALWTRPRHSRTSPAETDGRQARRTRCAPR